MIEKLKEELKRHTDYVLRKYRTNLLSYNINESDVNDVFCFEVSIGGAQGGSCWHDDPAEDYYLDDSEIKQNMYSEIYYCFSSFAQNNGFTNLDNKTWEIIDKIYHNNLDTRVDNEYYGNHTDYKLYSLSISEFVNSLEKKLTIKP